MTAIPSTMFILVSRRLVEMQNGQEILIFLPFGRQQNGQHFWFLQLVDTLNFWSPNGQQLKIAEIAMLIGLFHPFRIVILAFFWLYDMSKVKAWSEI